MPAEAQQKMLAWAPEIDPNNPRHVDAYLAVAAAKSRIRKEAVLAVIAVQETQVGRAQESSMRFVTAPRSNFENHEVPVCLRKYLRTLEFLKESFEVHDDGTDYGSIFIFDSAVTLQPALADMLGQNLGQLKFVMKIGRLTKALGEDAPPSSAPAALAPSSALAALPPSKGAAGGGAPFLAVAPVPAVALGPAVPPVEKAAVAPGPADTLAAAAGKAAIAPAAAAAVEDPSQKRPPGTAAAPAGEHPQKRPRTLRVCLSEASGSAVDDDTLAHLVEECNAAAAAGRITSRDPNNNKTLQFWASQVAAGLPALGGDAGDGGSAPEDCTEIVRQEFPGLLASLLRKHRCYRALPDFVKVFEELRKKGCKVGSGYVAIKAICDHPVASLAPLDLDGVGIGMRLKFGNCALWEDYMSARLPALLEAAKAATPGPARNRILQAASTVSESDFALDVPELRDAAVMAASLFDTELPLASRVAYAVEEESRVQYARGWKADFPFVALEFVYRTPPPASYYGLTHADFRVLADFLVTAEGADARACIENPVFVTILGFLDAAGAFRLEPWWPDFFHTLVAARLGCSAGWLPPAVNWTAILTSTAFLELEELVSKYFRTCKPGLGGWYLCMKGHADALRKDAGAQVTPRKQRSPVQAPDRATPGVTAPTGAPVATAAVVAPAVSLGPAAAPAPTGAPGVEAPAGAPVATADQATETARREDAGAPGVTAPTGAPLATAVALAPAVSPGPAAAVAPVSAAVDEAVGEAQGRADGHGEATATEATVATAATGVTAPAGAPVATADALAPAVSPGPAADAVALGVAVAGVPGDAAVASAADATGAPAADGASAEGGVQVAPVAVAAAAVPPEDPSAACAKALAQLAPVAGVAGADVPQDSEFPDFEDFESKEDQDAAFENAMSALGLAKMGLRLAGEVDEATGQPAQAAPLASAVALASAESPAPPAAAVASADAPEAWTWEPGDVAFISAKIRRAIDGCQAIVLGWRGVVVSGRELRLLPVEGRSLAYSESKQAVWVLARQCSKVPLKPGVMEAAMEQSSAVKCNPLCAKALRAAYPDALASDASAGAGPCKAEKPAEAPAPKKSKGFSTLASLFQKNQESEGG